MEEDILAKVLEAEKAIRERIKEEEENTNRWLRERKKAIENEKAVEMARLENSRLTNLDNAQKAALRKVSEMVEDANELHRLLSALDDDCLRRIVRKAVRRTVSG